jgi:hypothetical protein
MNDSRLRNKIQETRSIASDRGLDLRAAPLLACFEMPIWGAAVAAHEVAELARLPGTAVAVSSTDPLPEVRRALANAAHLHVVAERGLVCGLGAGATVHVYPSSPAEFQAFSVALFAGAAPADLRLALAPYVSSGRQEVTFAGAEKLPTASARELLHAIRNRGGNAAFASEAEDAVVVDDDPGELDAARAALSCDLGGQLVRVTRLPSGRFRLGCEARSGDADREQLQVVAQSIAISCDRFVEVRGPTTFGYVTEPVARWQYGPEAGAKRLANELFQAPDAVITQLGLHPFKGEGTLFFAYEGSETVWEAANKGIACITVRDIVEYARILNVIRRGGAS